MIDFEDIEVNEAVVHLKNILTHSHKLQHSTGIAVESDDEANFEIDSVGCVEEFKIHSCEYRCRKPLKQNRKRHEQARACTNQANAWARKVVNRWGSFAAALVRLESGLGRGPRGKKLFRAEIRCSPTSFDGPTLMPKFARWLRSPFVQEGIEDAEVPRSKKQKNKCNKRGRKCVIVGPNTNMQGSLAAIPCDGSQPPSASDCKKEGSLNRWEAIITNLISTTANNIYRHRRRFVQRVSPSTSEICRWSHLHGSNAAHTALRRHHKHLMDHMPPLELTMSFQIAQAETIQNMRYEKCILRRWSRMLIALCKRKCAAVRQMALQEIANRRWQPEDLGNERWDDNGAAVDESILAAQLGLDVATYRLLKQLEEREIMPEDYELLGRLDEVVKPTTITLEELWRFPTGVHCVGCTSTCNTMLPSFAMDFWRLPMQIQQVEKLEVEINCIGSDFDFWKLPVPVMDDDDVTTTLDSVSSYDDSNSVCGVCLVEFDIGDKLRSLPCGHSFHQECIDHWLLNSSTVCPIDKRDVREM